MPVMRPLSAAVKRTLNRRTEKCKKRLGLPLAKPLSLSYSHDGNAAPTRSLNGTQSYQPTSSKSSRNWWDLVRDGIAGQALRYTEVTSERRYFARHWR